MQHTVYITYILHITHYHIANRCFVYHKAPQELHRKTFFFNCHICLFSGPYHQPSPGQQIPALQTSHGHLHWEPLCWSIVLQVCNISAFDFSGCDRPRLQQTLSCTYVWYSNDTLYHLGRESAVLKGSLTQLYAAIKSPDEWMKCL